MKLETKSNRIGRFIISATLLRDAADHVTHEADAEFFAIFRRVIIVETRFRWAVNAVEYIGYCDQFEPVEFGCSEPLYDVEVVRSESSAGGLPIITFEPRFTRRKEGA